MFGDKSTYRVRNTEHILVVQPDGSDGIDLQILCPPHDGYCFLGEDIQYVGTEEFLFGDRDWFEQPINHLGEIGSAVAKIVEDWEFPQGADRNDLWFHWPEPVAIRVGYEHSSWTDYWGEYDSETELWVASEHRDRDI